MTLKKKTSTPTRRSKLAIAVRDRQPCDGTGCRGTRRLDATARNHRDGAEPDRRDTAPCRRERQCASPAQRPAAIANGRRQPQAAPPQQRRNRACCPSSPTSSRPSRWCPTTKSAAPAARTLGDLLFSKPGITGSSFAPGASSRPIIRGLDVNRVGIVENGTGAGGASDLGEDHFVPIDPLATSQIEVVRGPAALRYGSTSIGGVVSATNNRIPDALPTCPAPAFKTLRHAGERAAGRRAIIVMHERRDPHRRQFGRSRRRRRHPARCRRRQCRGSRRRLWPQGRRLQHPRAIPICSTRPAP